MDNILLILLIVLMLIVLLVMTILFVRISKRNDDLEKYVENQLEEKQNEEDYINLLKELGIYHEIYEIEEDEVSDDEYDYYIDDYEFIDYEDIELIDKDYRTKEEKARDRVTGPAFDPELKNKKQVWEEGPAFDENFK